MKAMLLIALWPVMAQAEEITLHFFNGDSMSGSWQDTRDDLIVLHSPFLADTAGIRMAALAHMIFPLPAAEEEEPLQGCFANVELTNSDRLRGKIRALTESHIELLSSFGATLSLRRCVVASVTLEPAVRVLYRGPRSLEEWRLGSENEVWRFDGEALLTETSGNISRTVNYTDQVRLAFDVEWRDALRARCVIFSDDNPRGPQNAGYEIAFNGSSAQLRKCANNQWLGHTPDAFELRENERARIELRVSRSTGVIALLINDRLVEQWLDENPAEGLGGSSLLFGAQESGYTAFSHIVVTEWDGQMEQQAAPPRLGNGQRAEWRDPRQLRADQPVLGPQPLAPPAARAPSANAQSKRMQLRNGDFIDGIIQSIEGDSVVLETSLGQVRFPVERLRNLALEPTSAERAKLYRNDIRLTLHDGSRFVARLDGMEDKKLVLFSQNFGSIQLPLTALRRVEFNIYRDMIEQFRRSR